MITPADSAPVAPAQMPVSAFDIIAPYDAGPEAHIQVHGDHDAGGQDKTSQTPDGAVAAAMARQAELQGDTFGQGSVIGDEIGLPALPGAYYDPPRDYGGMP